MPQHANSLGVTFGGHIIKLMESTAVVAASRYAHKNRLHSQEENKDESQLFVRTVSIDGLNFLKPTRIGDVVKIEAYVSRSWKSSMEVYVTVHSTSYNDADKPDPWLFTNDGYLTLIAVDEPESRHGSANDEHHFIALNDFIPTSPLTKWRHEFANERRQHRLQERASIEKVMVK
jgi:acyl-CoA hydrolase